jgi:hypothetical protein
MRPSNKSLSTVILVAAIAILSGCTTVTDSNGTTTRTVDWSGVQSGVSIAGGAFRDYKAIKELR